MSLSDMRHLMRLVEATMTHLFHTTSPASALDILTGHTLRPRNYDACVSLSEMPLPNGDIRDNGCTLVFSADAFGQQVVPVDYSRAWVDAHPAVAAYIAGEGWREQYEPPDVTDDDGWEDDAAAEADLHEAEVEAFLWKANEREHVCLTLGQPVRFQPQGVLAVLLHAHDGDDWRAELDAIGYAHVQILPGHHWPPTG